MFFAKKAAGKYPLNPELMKLKTKLSPPDAKWLNVSFTQSSVDIALKEIDEYLKKLDNTKKTRPSNSSSKRIEWEKWSMFFKEQYYSKITPDYDLNNSQKLLKEMPIPSNAPYNNKNYTKESIDRARSELKIYLNSHEPAGKHTLNNNPYKIKLGDQSPYHMPESQVQKKGKKVIRHLLPPPVVK